MDVAYNQHSPYSRHHGRSSTNLDHLTLAPLTSRLPLSDPDALPESTHHISYIEGRSAPTTPSILSRSSSRVSLRKPTNLSLPKSKSSTHLLVNQQQPRSGATTPGGTKLRKGITREEFNLTSLSAEDRNDSDWVLRAGAAISSSTRESKGQAWLVSRASSTSLQRDEDEEELERELAKEREQNSRINSRRGSSAAAAFDADDEFSPITTRRSLSFGPPTGISSRPMSRFGSRGNSRRGSRAGLFTPMGGEREGYFDERDFAQEELVEPDFVNAEEEEYETEDKAKQDEAIVRKLARASSLGLGGWVERMLGWSLFAVDEDGEDTEAETLDEKGDDSELSSRPSRRALDDITDVPPGEVMPPLRDEEAGGWQDAAWLLSVATKVLL
jgi:hypothetical protein